MYNKDFKKLIGKENLTISESMQKIDANACGILFIINNNGKMLGCLSDGDIRRFMLAGGKMSDSVLSAINTNPKTALSLEEAKFLYHKKYVVAVPIVDSNGKIETIYTEDGVLVKPKKSIGLPVVINAGGQGTRLDPFTRILPKPLIPVGDLPIIEHIMKEYQTYDCKEFHIIVNYKRDLMKAYFADSDNSYNITWYDEGRPLGTGGGLGLLRGRFTDTFFFTNCDVLLTANYESMLKFHKDNGNIITMVCAYKNLTIPYGVVEMGRNGLIKEMKEKPTMSFLTNTGIYIVEPDVIKDIMDGVPINFPDIVEIEKRKGRKVAVFPVSENDWMDMGQLSELEKMRVKLYGE